MNKKKKICIGVIVILSLTIISCCGGIVLKHKNLQIAKSDNTEEIQEEFVNEVIEENDLENENVIDENNVLDNENSIANETTNNNEYIKSTSSVQVATKQPQSSSQTQSASSIQTNTKQSETSKQTEVSSHAEIVKASTQVTTQVPIQINEVKEPKQEQQQQQPVTPPVTKPAEPTKEEPKPETKEEELYVRNDAMINQIRQVIESNVSENMMTYGYEIVVDSSIKELTNQFTYTENRVKNAISSKFGTIRIYAEDYYRNGQLIMTECYII